MIGRLDDWLKVVAKREGITITPGHLDWGGIAVFNDPVDPAVVDELYRKFSEFRRAYDEDGLSVPEFDHYGATVRTLRSFIEAYRDLTAVVRDSMLPPV